jgi:MerR family transcriptional regulator, light-induced transcriptional regulator
MYTIKQAAARSGVPVQLLRAWERRYGVVSPARTASRYRLYDDAAIARLRAMRQLIDEGWAPSTAAAHIVALDDAAIETIAGTVPEAVGAPPRTARAAATDESLTDAFVSSAAALDEIGVEQVLDEMFARGSFEQVTTELVMPALVALGDGWAEGKVDVAAEHAAAGAVQRRLGMAFMAAGVPRDEDVVLVGLPPGAWHDLGALAFATAARRAGIAVRYLGADLPVRDWLAAIASTKARGVVVGVVIGRDVKPAQEVARSIREAHPHVLVAFGGRQAEGMSTDGLEPALVLPQDLPAAVEALRTELAAAA